MNMMTMFDVPAAAAMPLVRYEDPLDDDAPTDAAVMTTRRGLARLALVAAETGARFQREAVEHDPMSWLLAPRALFGGASAIEACLERQECLRGILLHGLSLGLDADAVDIDALVAESDGDEAIFLKALAHVLDMEGGYSNDPYDPGGPTNRGITLDVYAGFKKETVDDASRARLVAELKRIPDATVTTIYRQRYFTPAACPVFTAPLALMHFDAAVNHGVGDCPMPLSRLSSLAKLSFASACSEPSARNQFMYSLAACWAGSVASAFMKRYGCGALTMMSLCSNCGNAIAKFHATAPPQSCATITNFSYPR